MFQDGPIRHLLPASSGRSVQKTTDGAAAPLIPRSGRRRGLGVEPRGFPSRPTHADQGPAWAAPGSRRTPAPGPTRGFQSLPSQQFQALFDSLFKVLFIFPSRYLFAIGLPSIFSLRWDLPPAWGCIPKQPDSARASRGVTTLGAHGVLTLSDVPFQGTWTRGDTKTASIDYNSPAESWRFSRWALPGSLAVTRGILVSFSSSAY